MLNNFQLDFFLTGSVFLPVLDCGKIRCLFPYVNSYGLLNKVNISEPILLPKYNIREVIRELRFDLSNVEGLQLAGSKIILKRGT